MWRPGGSTHRHTTSTQPSAAVTAMNGRWKMLIFVGSLRQLIKLQSGRDRTGERSFTVWPCSCDPWVSPVWWPWSCRLWCEASQTWTPLLASVSLKYRAHGSYTSYNTETRMFRPWRSSPANILLKSLESIFMITSALTDGSPGPTLPAPLFRSRNQIPACSPYGHKDSHGTDTATNRDLHRSTNSWRSQKENHLDSQWVSRINFGRIHFKYLQLIQSSDPMTSAVHQGHLMRPVKTSNLDLNSLWWYLTGQTDKCPALTSQHPH